MAKAVNAGKLVLSQHAPTPLLLKPCLDKYRSQINGMVHCSGGAQTKVLHFIDSCILLKITSSLFHRCLS
jgi:phosphoribosylformylglycinamidine cyclo-ligase